MPNRKINCLLTEVPLEHRTIGVPDTDLLIYMTTADENIDYLSYSG